MASQGQPIVFETLRIQCGDVNRSGGALGNASGGLLLAKFDGFRSRDLRDSAFQIGTGLRYQAGNKSSGMSSVCVEGVLLGRVSTVRG